MNEIKDVEEYEENFLKEYIEKKSKAKIEKLRQQIEECKNSDNLEKIKLLERKIQKIEEDLEIDRRFVEEKEKEKEVKLTTKNIKIENIKAVESDNKNKVYKRNLEKAIEKYCIAHKIEHNVFWEHIKENAHRIDDLYVPFNIWDCLFDYQKTSLEWMYNLFKKRQGGILADEMGLGKTVQVISFTSALLISKLARNALVLCPSTIMNLWINEWKRFFPFLRVFFVHKSQSDSISSIFSSINSNENNVAVISYDGFKKYYKKLKEIKWNVMILDEGHKIKNKSTIISKYAKDFVVDFKLIMTGTPIQNNLSELWTLIDFVNPGQLGTYATFVEEFEEPIKKGGYTNSSTTNIEVAYKASVFLRSIIKPNIMRRLKSQVAEQLPKKIDKVVFCALSDIQAKIYKKTLESDYILKILEKNTNILQGIDILRKICNHPFLLKKRELVDYDEHNYNLINLSGKMQVLKTLLKKWHSEEKKVLIFSQTISMLDIIEKYLCIKEYSYLRMDGKTPLKVRSENIYEFNENRDIFVFLLTTRVGGMGVSLVGASRVIIYDPDWNPSIDNQAKERVWRYGQLNEVEIYRFVCVNTIEEKIYQKQIFKNLLSKKILKNPKTSRLFDKSDLVDLFSYSEDNRNVGVVKKIDETELFTENDDLKKFIKETEAIDKVLNGKEMIDFILCREKLFSKK